MSDQEQLTPQQEREYVEAAWVHVRTVFPCASGRYLIQIDPDSRLDNAQFEAWLNTEAAAWHAAFLFTKDRERTIAEVWEQVKLAKYQLRLYEDQFHLYKVQAILDQRVTIQLRTIAVLEAALSDLLRGWRDKGDGNGRG